MQANQGPNVLGRDGVEVAVGDQDLAGTADGPLGGDHGVPGPERLPLLDEHGLGDDAPRPDGLADLVGAVVHDDRDRLGPCRPDVPHDPPQGGPPADGMEHLRGRGLQSLPLARGEHDRGERCGRGHRFLSVDGHPLYRRGEAPGKAATTERWSAFRAG